MGGIPKAVEEQARKADELQKKLAAVPGEEEGVINDGKTREPEEVPAAPVAGGDDGHGDGPAPREVHDEGGTPVDPEARGGEDSKWEHKYRVLKGKYDKEISELYSRIDTLNDVIVEMGKRASTPPEPQAAGRGDGTRSEIDSAASGGGPDIDALREAYGDEYVDNIILVAKAAAPSGGDADLRKSVDELRREFSRNRFLDALTERAPQWRDLDQDEGFLDWLDEVDELTGFTRKAHFDVFLKNGDVERVAKFFNSYTGNISPAGKGREPHPDLQRQVAPPRGGGSTPRPQGQKGSKTWTDASIKEFYHNWQRGAIAEKDAVLMEQDILRARAEGRYRPV